MEILGNLKPHFIFFGIHLNKELEVCNGPKTAITIDTCTDLKVRP